MGIGELVSKAGSVLWDFFVSQVVKSYKAIPPTKESVPLRLRWMATLVFIRDLPDRPNRQLDYILRKPHIALYDHQLIIFYSTFVALIAIIIINWQNHILRQQTDAIESEMHQTKMLMVGHWPESDKIRVVKADGHVILAPGSKVRDFKYSEYEALLRKVLEISINAMIESNAMEEIYKLEAQKALKLTMKAWHCSAPDYPITPVQESSEPKMEPSEPTSVKDPCAERCGTEERALTDSLVERSPVFSHALNKAQQVVDCWKVPSKVKGEKSNEFKACPGLTINPADVLLTRKNFEISAFDILKEGFQMRTQISAYLDGLQIATLSGERLDRVVLWIDALHSYCARDESDCRAFARSVFSKISVSLDAATPSPRSLLDQLKPVWEGSFIQASSVEDRLRWVLENLNGNQCGTLCMKTVEDWIFDLKTPGLQQSTKKTSCESFKRQLEK